MQDEQYFSTQPQSSSNERASSFIVAGKSLRLVTDRGVFSKKGVDQGTQILLEAAPKPPSSGTFLDLGCGSGAIALALASHSPNADVVAIDINTRALKLVASNAVLNELTNITAMLSSSVPADQQFDLIWSNPPIRIGKQALHELLSTWLNRLSVQGEAWLVINRNLGSDSLAVWLIDQGYVVNRLTSKRGFRVLKVKRKA